MKTTATSQETASQAGTDASEDELVWGASAIGRVINRKPRAVYHLHEKGAIPTKSVAGRLCGKKSNLLAIAG
jgi:hypothetical protein